MQGWFVGLRIKAKRGFVGKKVHCGPVQQYVVSRGAPENMPESINLGFCAVFALCHSTIL